MKKKGFTLIELLAVIIVLAIIALIATPIIFNVIENAKLKSLENSCYGIIDTVRTNYAENLLNSTDGQVKLKGSVTELTVAGEKPIAGTWEIDNTVDSNDRGIKIKDVKFASMKDYTCTNVNSDGTINSKVMCTKSGEDETDLTDFTITEIYDFEMDMDACISKYEGSNTEGLDGYEASHEEAVDICNNNRPISGFFYIDEYLYMIAGNETELKKLIDSGMIKLKIDYSIDFDGCMSYFLGDDIDEDISDEDIEYVKSLCRNEVEVEQGKTIKELVDELISTNDITAISELENGGLIKINNKLKLITGYNGTDKNIVIPKEATAILGNTYFAEKEIESVDFSKAKNLTTIGFQVFNKNKISSLDLSGATKLKTIGSHAFNHNQISDIKFSSSIKSIGDSAFYSNQLTNLIISDNVETINSYAFANNKLTTIKIPNSLTTIDNNAFSNNQLTSVEMSNGVTTIGGSAFEDNQLTSIVIPNSVTFIGVSAFEDNQLTSIVIPNSVKEIEERAFNNNQLSDEDAFIYARTDKNNDGIAEIDTTTIVSYGGMKKDSVIIPNGVTTIGDGAFYNSQLTSITIPNSVKKIGKEAFENNKLTSVEIPNSVTTIGISAFRSNQLTSVEIPNSVKEIGDYAFISNSIKQITIDNTKDAITGSPWGADNATITWKRS